MNAFSSVLAARTVGVLGGMGPLATVDFLSKLIAETPARCDQEHVPLLVRFCPEVPDRTAALLGSGPSPLPGLIAAARRLEAAGAGCLAIPCNTAHAWHKQIESSVCIPVMHIVDATLAQLGDLVTTGPVGLLATSGTLRSRIYQQRSQPGVEWLVPDVNSQEQWIMPGIHAVKAGDTEEGTQLLLAGANALIQGGARTIVMACTEVPIAMAGQDLGLPLIDPTQALAKACVAWFSTPGRALHSSHTTSA